MPFLAAAIPALIGTGVSAGASYGLGKLLNRPSDAQKQAQENLLDTSGAAKALAMESGRKGLSFLDAGQRTLAQPKNFYAGILSGNPTQVSEALAPDINRIRGANQQTTQTIANLTPRGGGRGETLFNLPYKTTNDVMDLLTTARPMAAQGLTDIGSREAAAGSAGLGSAGQFIYGANSGAANILSQEMMRKQMEYERGAAMGPAIFDIMNKIDYSKLMKTPPFVGSTRI